MIWWFQELALESFKKIDFKVVFRALSRVYNAVFLQEKLIHVHLYIYIYILYIISNINNELTPSRTKLGDQERLFES